MLKTKFSLSLIVETVFYKYILRCLFQKQYLYTLYVSPSVATPSWTVVGQVPLSTGLSKQEYWRGLPFPSPSNLPNPGIEPRSPALQRDSLLSGPPGNLKYTQ